MNTVMLPSVLTIVLFFNSYSSYRLDSLETADAVYGYEYDSNGNMIFDGRNALNFNYNYLNLVREVTDEDDELAASYVWAADGINLG
jgi:hypothetical protein